MQECIRLMTAVSVGGDDLVSFFAKVVEEEEDDEESEAEVVMAESSREKAGGMEGGEVGKERGHSPRVPHNLTASKKSTSVDK